MRVNKAQIGNNNTYIYNDINTDLIKIIMELVKSQNETIRILRKQLSKK